MKSAITKAMTLVALAAALASCIDHANAPLLVPVASTVNPPDVAHGICIADGNAMYDEARKQYEIRASLTGMKPDATDQETTARSAARRQYLACVSSQGYRTVYPQ